MKGSIDILEAINETEDSMNINEENLTKLPVLFKLEVKEKSLLQN